MKGREKVDWLGTREPEAQHNGELLGVSFASSIPDLELKKPTTQNHQQIQTTKAPPKKTVLFSKNQKRDSLARQNFQITTILPHKTNKTNKTSQNTKPTVPPLDFYFYEAVMRCPQSPGQNRRQPHRNSGLANQQTKRCGALTPTAVKTKLTYKFVITVLTQSKQDSL